MQKTWIRVLTTALTVGTMVLIFGFSMESAETSDQTSGWISRTVIHVLYTDYSAYSAERQVTVYDQVQHMVRKTAHFTEYLILGILIRFCLESWIGGKKHLLVYSWGIGTLYAGTDELHQLLSDGRSGQWADVALDSGGVLAGVLLAMLVLFLTARKRMIQEDETNADERGSDES